MEVKVDASGRMVIPARLRRLLGIGEDGGTVDVVDTADGLSIRPHDDSPPQIHRDEHGLLVIDTGRVVTTREVSDAIDEDRARRG